MAGPGHATGSPLAGQSYQERRPADALSGLVSSVWVQHVPEGGVPYAHRSIPNGTVEVRCRIGESPTIAGPITGPRTDVLAPGSTLAGVRFHPGAAARVLGVPPTELTDLVLDASELWGHAATATGERLAQPAPPARAAALLQELIASRLVDAADPDPLIAEAVRRMMPWWGGDISSLRSSLFVSERQFRRRCEAAVGIAPKTLQRMLKFQGFLAQAQFALARGKNPAGDGLAQLAADAGYADQSHLARECLRLTGVTPGVFLRQTAQQCGCGHDHEASYAPLLRYLRGREPPHRRGVRAV
jgi:AraC-like DNA-binding protein